MNDSKPSADEIRGQIYETLANIAVAFGSPCRLRIINVLAQGPRGVDELANETEQPVGNTSQHLQRLAKEGIVRVSKQGTSRIYSLSDPKMATLWEILQEAGHGVAPELNVAEDSLTDASLRASESLSEILDLVKAEKAVLVDVRPSQEADATPFEDALAVPLEELKKRMDEFPKRKPIFVFCRGRYCRWASEAVRQLRAAGFKASRLRASSHRLGLVQNATQVVNL